MTSRNQEFVIHGEHYPECLEKESLGSLLLRKMEKYSEKITHINATSETSETFSSLRRRSIWVAEALIKRGVKLADVICICARNTADTFATAIGAIFAGCQINVLAIGMGKDDYLQLLNTIKPNMIFCEFEQAAILERVLEDLKMAPELIVYSANASSPHSSFQEFQVDNGTDQTFKVAEIQDVTKTPVLIVCSSGTTGVPKGVQVSHYTVIRQMVGSFFEENVVLLSNTLFWATGWITLFGGLITGACRIFYTTTLTEELSLRYVEKYKINVVMCAVSLINRWIIYKDFMKYDLSSLKGVYTTGSIVPENTALTLKRLLPNCKVKIVFGMSEFGGCTTMTDGEGQFNSVGKLKQGVSLKVIDLDSGDILGPNQQGELCMKHDCMMLGYVNDPKKTAELFDEEGWLHTGDIGYYDDNEVIFVCSRKKDMLKFQSYQICPAEIENLLITHPGVADAIVVGVPHDTDGDLLVAFVMKAEHRDTSEAEIKQFVADRLADWKRLRGGVVFVNEMRLVPSLKVDKKYYKQLALDMRDQIVKNAE